MSAAIITLSKAAKDLALKIKQKQQDSIVYTMPKQVCEKTKPIEGSLNKFIGGIFSKYETLIFIMSTGIVVRTIAPYLKHKSIDPAILVLDSKGDYVISLLSGHLGGANKKAEELAKVLNATPVITTASDLANKLAVDMFAKENNLIIIDFNQAKTLTSLIINDEQVGILTDFSLKQVSLPSNVDYIKKVNKDLTGVIYITNKEQIEDIPCAVAKLIKPNVVIGIGCKRGVSADHILQTVLTKLKKINIDKRAVKRIASVDLKRDEQGIIELAKKLNAEYVTYSVAELKLVEHLFEGSPFVKNTIGVASVCEPAGLLASNYGKCLLVKEKQSGVTLSFWQEE